MNKKGVEMNFFTYSVIVIVAVVLMGFLIGFVADTKQDIRTTSTSSSTNLSPATSLTTTLTVEEGITSKNLQTAENVSLNFDGVNDVVTFDISQSKAVKSFWFKNATTDWTSVIVNYDDVYVDNVLDAGWDYLPYYVSGDNVYLGKFDATTFFNGSIDNFQIYESKLSESEVETIYNEGH